jgi:hypothetical protein
MEEQTGAALDPVSAIEAVFNRLRLKYLQAIALSPALRDRPSKAVSASFNPAFHSLAGLEVHRKADPKPENDWFWRSCGFDPRAKHELDWERERNDLASAVQDLVLYHGAEASTTYAEIIALQPGFHEAWLHEQFPNDIHEGPESPRGRVFAILRGGAADLAELEGRYPRNLADPESFMWYAPCAVTEGPFVRRKGPRASYFEELRRVGVLPHQADRRAILEKSFFVLDPWQRLQDEDNAPALERLIHEAEAFLVAMGG